MNIEHIKIFAHTRTYVHESWNCYQYSEQKSFKVLESCLLYQKDQRTRLCPSVLVRWLFFACVSCAKERARSVAFVQPGTFQVQWHFLCPTCLRLVLWSCFLKANDSCTYQAMAFWLWIHFGFKNIQSILNFANMRNICRCGYVGSINWTMSMTIWLIWLYYGNVSDMYSSVLKQKHLSAMPLKDKTYWQACVSPDPFLCFDKKNHEISLNFTISLSSKLHCMTACPTWNLKKNIGIFEIEVT